MFNSEQNVYDLVSDIEAMKKIFASNPWVHSIYLYNSRLDTFYIIGEESLVREGEMYDEGAKQLLADREYMSNHPIARQIPFGENEPDEIINIYSYILRSENEPGIGLPDAVIVNVYSEALFSSGLPAEKGENEVRGVISINSQGMINGSSYADLFLQDISHEPYVQKIMSGTGDSGYFVDNSGRDRYLVTYVKNDSLDWIFLSRIPHSQIDVHLNKIILVSIILAAVVIAVSVVSSYFVSRSIYAPIDKFKAAVRKNDFTSSIAYKKISELKSIADHYQLMYNELKNLEDYKTRSFQFEKNRIIKNLLFKASPSKEELLNLFKEYEIQLNFREPAVLYILQIDSFETDYQNKLSVNDQQLYKYALEKISKEFIYEHFTQCEIVEADQDIIAVIVSLNKEQYNYVEIVPLLKDCISKTREKILERWSVGFSGFISKITENLFTIGEAYSDVVELSKQRMIHGHGCILSPEDTETPEESFLGDNYIDPVLEEKIEELLETLKTGNKEKVLETYNAIVGEMSENNSDMITYIMLYINSLIMNTVILMERNSNIEFSIDFLKINQQLSDCETLSEITIIFKAMFKRIISTIENQKNNRQEDFIKRINEYIEKNYMFETLSSTEISEKFGLSQSYLNRIYRKACYTSISNYIKKIRLEKAAELILETDYTIDTILDRIGWVTKEYFYSSFKKHFGVTPGDYKYKNNN
jgi:AraC-like DNA-binding protein